MVIEPSDLTELSALLASCHREGRAVTGYGLSALNRLLEHAPEDMTAAVEAGATLAAFQAEVGRKGQWLPVDPPRPGQLTIGALLATNANGPHRFGYGTVREHLIGIQAVLADGTVIRAGGNVVKNVAGFDLCKLFVGSRGTLGVITEARFKLRPFPESEQVVQREFDSWDEAAETLERVWDSDLTPVVMDVHNLEATGEGPHLTCVLAFAGSHEEVAWQANQGREQGFTVWGNLEYHARFWADPAAVEPQSWSVLPSRVIPALQQLGPEPFVAHAGNGVIWSRARLPELQEELPVELIRRTKDTFDPKHILPSLA
jgi:glycolate oxidase FAD binding subunit